MPQGFVGLLGDGGFVVFWINYRVTIVLELLSFIWDILFKLYKNTVCKVFNKVSDLFMYL